jgi:hypothetical protein
MIQMKKCAAQFIYGILAALIIFSPLPLHGAQPKKLRLAFSAFAYATRRSGSLRNSSCSRSTATIQS